MSHTNISSRLDRRSMAVSAMSSTGVSPVSLTAVSAVPMERARCPFDSRPGRPCYTWAGRPCYGTRHAAAFTLLEMLLSIGIIAILLTATVSTLFVAQRAVASGADSADRTSQESWAMQMITMDVSLATAFTEHTDRAITMTVPDRTGDGQPETIRYAWSGTPGDPLTRQVNGGTAVVLANNVYQLRLTYLTRTTP